MPPGPASGSSGPEAIYAFESALSPALLLPGRNDVPAGGPPPSGSSVATPLVPFLTSATDFTASPTIGHRNGSWSADGTAVVPNSPSTKTLSSTKMRSLTIVGPPLVFMNCHVYAPRCLLACIMQRRAYHTVKNLKFSLTIHLIQKRITSPITPFDKLRVSGVCYRSC